MKTRALRRLLALTISLLPVAIVACSSPEAHPPVLGDCIGQNCPPAQSRGGSSVSSGDGDGSASADSSSDGGGASDGASTTDGGASGTDAGLGGD